MSETIWCNRRPGEIASVSTEEDHPDEHMVIVGSHDPDWIRLPPELGGTQHRVKDIYPAICPMCLQAGKEIPARIYELEDTPYQCAECPRDHGFVWFQLKEMPT